jgi:hypothetical protein
MGTIAKTEIGVQAMRMSMVNHCLPEASIAVRGNNPALKMKRFPKAHTP